MNQRGLAVGLRVGGCGALGRGGEGLDLQHHLRDEALAGHQNVKIMAHFVSQSRDSASNNLHRVWDEKDAAKNPNPKRKVG